MGLFDFLRSKDENAIPQPGTPEFDAAVAGTAIPDAQSVGMGEGGWSSADQIKEMLANAGMDPDQPVQVEQGQPQTIDLRGTGARENVEEVLRKHGIDPDKPGQQVDATSVPGLQQALLGALGMSGLQIPNAEGFGGGISPPEVDSLAQIEYLATKRDSGEITEAEFEAQKRKLLGSGADEPDS